ncbi:radical SAM protein [Candidatus Latescibacterota bacterium]
MKYLGFINKRRYPHSLGIFLTRKCNFNCIYCSVEKGPDPEDKLTLNELENLIRQAKSFNIQSISIAGEGEPFLDDNLLPFLDIIEKNNLRCCVFTNGSLIDQSIAENLLKKRVVIGYKLNSFSKEIQDIMAGKKNCHKWVEYAYKEKRTTQIKQIPLGLKILLDKGFASESLLFIETVIAKPNLSCIPLIANFCKSHGIYFYVETLIVSNKAADNYDILKIDKVEEAKLYRELCSISGVKFRIANHTRCIFETSPFVDINGNIRFCFGLPADIGNIRDFSLEQLHVKEQKLRKSMGLKSTPFYLPSGLFRECAVRKYVNSSYNKQ